MSTVAIIGAGNVGEAIAYSLCLTGTIDTLLLLDKDTLRVKGEVLDLQQSLPLTGNTVDVVAAENKDIAQADVIVLTAGKKGKPGQSRLELLQENTQVVDSILEEIQPFLKKDAIFLVVSNPVDVLTYYIWKKYGFSRQQVVGTGTILDTARFRGHLSKKIGVAPSSIHAYVLGEHGDSSVPVWSSAQVGGKKLLEYYPLTSEEQEEISQRTRAAAQEIIQTKGYTNLAIGVCVNKLVQAFLHDSHQIFPMSCIVQGEYGCADVAFGVPAIVTRQGWKDIVGVSLVEEEKEKLIASMRILQNSHKQILTS